MKSIIKSTFILLYIVLANGCQEEKCQNGGILVLDECQCPEGFGGEKCTEKLCPVACKHGGKCIDGACQCPPGWTGPDCGTPADPCNGYFCANGGRCENGVCVCPPGCSGIYCESCEEVTTVMAEQILKLCPQHTGGDPDFCGKGPRINVNVEIYKVNERELWVRVNFSLVQTEKANLGFYFDEITTATKLLEKRIWLAPYGYRINSIKTDLKTTVSHLDRDINVDVFQFQANELVNRLEILGDTGGEDVGDCTNDHSYLTVLFNPIKVGLKAQ
jgi:hypothetical protein